MVKFLKRNPQICRLLPRFGLPFEEFDHSYVDFKKKSREVNSFHISATRMPSMIHAKYSCNLYIIYGYQGFQAYIDTYSKEKGSQMVNYQLSTQIGQLREIVSTRDWNGLAPARCAPIEVEGLGETIGTE